MRRRSLLTRRFSRRFSRRFRARASPSVRTSCRRFTERWRRLRIGAASTITSPSSRNPAPRYRRDLRQISRRDRTPRLRRDRSRVHGLALCFRMRSARSPLSSEIAASCGGHRGRSRREIAGGRGDRGRSWEIACALSTRSPEMTGTGGGGSSGGGGRLPIASKSIAGVPAGTGRLLELGCILTASRPYLRVHSVKNMCERRAPCPPLTPSRSDGSRLIKNAEISRDRRRDTPFISVVHPYLA